MIYQTILVCDVRFQKTTIFLLLLQAGFLPELLFDPEDGGDMFSKILFAFPWTTRGL
jgi:hypothetical protein